MSTLKRSPREPARPPCLLRAVSQNRTGYEEKGAERKIFGWDFFNRQSGESLSGFDK